MLSDLHSKHVSNTSTLNGFVWEQFNFMMCGMAEWKIYTWCSVILLCTVIGFPACAVTLWEIFKTHRNGTLFTPNNFFMLNVSIMDAIFLAFLPIGILNDLTWNSWVIEACWNASYALNLCGRPLLMACICLDCYLAVVHPVTYLKRKSMTPRVVMVGIVWTLTAACATLYLLFFKLFFSLVSTIPFLIANVIIGICDFLILHALVKSKPGRKNIHPQKQRAVQTIINSLVLTMCSYFPIFLLIAIGQPLSLGTFICVLGPPIAVCSSLGSVIMPVLHIINKGTLGHFRLGCSQFKIRWCRA